MENETTLDFGAATNEHLEISTAASVFLREAAKWAQFLAILGFIGIALMAIMGLFMGVFMNRMVADQGLSSQSYPSVYMTLFYVVIAGVYFIPVLQLFKFAKTMKKALANNDQGYLDSSFEYLKSHYKTLGIISIVAMCFYAIAIIGMISAFAFMDLGAF